MSRGIGSAQRAILFDLHRMGAFDDTDYRPAAYRDCTATYLGPPSFGPSSDSGRRATLRALRALERRGLVSAWTIPRMADGAFGVPWPVAGAPELIWLLTPAGRAVAERLPE